VVAAPSEVFTAAGDVPCGTECNGYDWAFVGHFLLPVTDAVFEGSRDKETLTVSGYKGPIQAGFQRQMILGVLAGRSRATRQS